MDNKCFTVEETANIMSLFAVSIVLLRYMDGEVSDKSEKLADRLEEMIRRFKPQNQDETLELIKDIAGGNKKLFLYEAMEVLKDKE